MADLNRECRPGSSILGCGRHDGVILLIQPATPETGKIDAGPNSFEFVVSEQL